jgi:hypothetical protein
MRKENAMAKINIIGLVPPTDKRYNEGYSIAVQPDPEELKRATEKYLAWKAAKNTTPKKPQGKK